MTPNIDANKSSVSSTSSFSSTIDFTATNKVFKVVNKITELLKATPELNPEEHLDWQLDDVLLICEEAIQVLKTDGSSALLRLGSDSLKEQWAIFGDLHGQYNEMIQILKRFTKDWLMRHEEGLDMKYLFLGDYVDRGNHSLEVIMSLLIWKINAPDQVFLLRGNHECSTVNQRYGFQSECVRFFGLFDGMKVWNKINEVFNYFPLAAIVKDKYFCVHGGLSENLVVVEQIEHLQLPYNLQEGSSCIGNDIVWSDPDLSNSVHHFKSNPKRGPVFGYNAVDDFFSCNLGLEMIIRAHQTAMDGFWTVFDKRVVTVFSAPDYRGCCKNMAAIMVLRPTDPECILQFEKCEDGKVKAHGVVTLD